jgi:hypothetical protein
MDKTSGGDKMIKTEFLNNGTLIKHYSDEGYMLLQNETGIEYADPVDSVPCKYTYTETDKLVESDEDITPEEFMTMLEEVL